MSPPNPVLDTCQAGGLGTGRGLRGSEGRLGRPPWLVLQSRGICNMTQSQLWVMAETRAQVS